MRLKRIAFMSVLKEDKVDQYIKAHDALTQEVRDVYRAGGIRAISCFVKDHYMFCFQEIDLDIYENGGKELLEQHPVSVAFDKTLEGVDADEQIVPGFFDEVFYLGDYE